MVGMSLLELKKIIIRTEHRIAKIKKRFEREKDIYFDKNTLVINEYLLKHLLESINSYRR